MTMRVIKVSNLRVREVWLDTSMPLRQGAESLGMSVDALRARAVAMGLPARKAGRREVIQPQQEAGFRMMWISGVSAYKIAAHFGCSYFAVVNTAGRLGLKARGVAYRPKIEMTTYREISLRIAMSGCAAEENARLQDLKN